uniref:Uncharacterized protein n=1 Tax=Glossina palpalis gambiensis TaxID=67801 RepID=A0A1B0BNB4_9MUSC
MEEVLLLICFGTVEEGEQAEASVATVSNSVPGAMASEVFVIERKAAIVQTPCAKYFRFCNR